MWLITGVIKWTLILQGVPSTKFGRVKNVQNSALFLTTFDFDCKYLRNVSTYRKSEKYLINNISFPIGQKIWWTLVHKPKSYRRACWPTQLDFFRETIFWPLGALAPQIFTRPTSPMNCISSRTWGAGRPQVGLCPIFLVIFTFLCMCLYVICVFELLTLPRLNFSSLVLNSNFLK